MIAPSTIPNPATPWVAADPLVQRWQRFFAPIDWAAVDAPRWRGVRPGPVPHPPSVYLKVLLIKAAERLPSIPCLHTYLVDHPALVVALGFRPVPDPTHPLGFAVAKTVPCERWLRRQQQAIDAVVVERLLTQTVQELTWRVPELGETVAFDTTHILAYVRENNPKESIPQRYAKGRQPRGDRDCRLGAKALVNQARSGRRGKKSYFYGYCCGMAATTVSAGNVVLATHTLPCNHQDIVHFHPLYEQVTAALGRLPTNVTADAAFDAWHVYSVCGPTGGIPAIAPNRRGPAPARSADGHPRCDKGLVMTPTTIGQHEDGYRVQHYACPLRGTGTTCDDARFARGGCRKRINIEPGGLLRAQIDRTDAAYKTVYTKRTSVERVYSQAKATGLERPIVRTQSAVARLAALAAITINLRVIARLLRPITWKQLTLC